MTTDRNSEGAVACMCCGAPVTVGFQPVRPFPGEEGEQEEVETYTYAAPASIPAAEVQALVEMLREQANESDRIADTFDDPDRRNWYQGRAEGYEAAADNLALLIPRNPE